MMSHTRPQLHNTQQEIQARKTFHTVWFGCLADRLACSMCPFIFPSFLFSDRHHACAALDCFFQKQNKKQNFGVTQTPYAEFSTVPSPRYIHVHWRYSNAGIDMK